jgi:hypothetical protein
MTNAQDLKDACQHKLEEYWSEINSLADKNISFLSDQLLLDQIKRSINSQTKSYRYVLLTQLLAKVVDPLLDSRSLMMRSDLEGAFDPRSLCKNVIVLFDGTNENVLGGSQDPYVSKPLRHSTLSLDHIDELKDKEGWRVLCAILDDIENKKEPEFTEAVLKQTLLEIYHRLSTMRVKYPIPKRISLQTTKNIIKSFLEIQSGGEHPVVVTYSIFKTIGNRFNLYDEIKRAKINASDSSTGMTSDIQCFSEGEIVLTIEVKDIELSISPIKSKLKYARSQQVSNLLFIAQKGVRDREEIGLLIEHEFSGGQNLYVFDIMDFMSPILVLLDEEGRIEFLTNICETLDGYSEIKSRQDWSRLLFEI